MKTITEKEMAVLLEIQDGVNELIEVLKPINNGFQDVGIIKKLSRVEVLLQTLSPVYRGEEEIGPESVFWNAVLGTEQDMSSRVSALMGED